MVEVRIERARLSLEGLTVGDCFSKAIFVGFGEFRNPASSIEGLVEKHEPIPTWV